MQVHTQRLLSLSCRQHTKTAPQRQVLLQLRAYAEDGSGKGDDEDPQSLAGRIMRSFLGKGSTPEGDQAAKKEPEQKADDSEGDSGSAIVPSLPERRFREVLAVPLNRRPLFPGAILPVPVSDPKLVEELRDMRRNGGQMYVGAFLKRPEDSSTTQASPFPLASARDADDSPPTTDDSPAAAGDSSRTDDSPAAGDSSSAARQRDAVEPRRGDAAAEGLHEVGTLAQVHTIAGHTEGPGAQLLLFGHRRLKRVRVVGSSPLRVAVEHISDPPIVSDDTLRATKMELVSTLRELMQMHPLYNEQLRGFAAFGGDFEDPARLADVCCSLTSAEGEQLQRILEELSVPDRAHAALLLLKKEVELCKLQADIGKRVEEKISKDQRRYFLQEQLKSIKKELGLEQDDKSALIQKFRERLAPQKGQLPEAAQKVIEEELAKLGSLEASSSEFNVTRNYLDWLTSLPWGITSPERLDLTHAEQVLNEDHYGLDDVKDRILEFIAVGKLRGSTHGKILCLVGPPGVGKTSVGKSIARSLHRKYFRFSVGGLSDTAEIKGHRRTYVGAMPGKMVQCLKSTGTSNPLVLIDEVDKLGRGYQGDPASALLELLDPEQNSSFVDHYLDVPIDLSKVLFMCTANVLDSIPAPLLDRMEVLRISGYTAHEKQHIARQYLQPQAAAEAGVPPDAVQITDPAMSHLIGEYCREAGVRNLKKQLEKIFRKSARTLVERGVGGPPPAPPITPAQSASAVQPSLVEVSPASGSSSEELPSSAPESPHTPGRADESSSPFGWSASSPPTEQLSDRWAHDDDSSQREHERLRDASSPHESSPVAESPPSVAESSTPSAESLPTASQPQAAARDFGEAIIVDRADLHKYIGQPPFSSDKIYTDDTPPGVVMGLAWTAMGGNSLYIEAASISKAEGKGSIRCTGQLGDVMKESASIAHTFTRSFFSRLKPGDGFFEDQAIHVHVPAGATPKDGPSAGCTMITALLSLALDKPVKANLAMTGEVTLTGKVLPIGGLKEKLLAAKRSDVTTVLFPEGNRKDWDELSGDVTEGITAHFVSNFDDVYKVALDY